VGLGARRFFKNLLSSRKVGFAPSDGKTDFFVILNEVKNLNPLKLQDSSLH